MSHCIAEHPVTETLFEVKSNVQSYNYAWKCSKLMHYTQWPAKGLGKPFTSAVFSKFLYLK